MIRVSQVKLPVEHSASQLEEKLRKILKLNRNQPFSYEIEKSSLDARKKPELFYVYTVAVTAENEEGVAKRAKSPSVVTAQKECYKIPEPGEKRLLHPPVIVGAGPAGLFAALLLTERGFCPIVLERGESVENRKKSVQKFWETGVLDPSSNVQFGEGGAGTFSDGKLNTAVKDKYFRNRFVLETFVKYGAPEEILIDAKPHIGTDILCDVIANMRRDLQAKGCRFYFNTKAEDFLFEGKHLVGIACETAGKGQKAEASKASFILQAEVAILAIGHSARDTFVRLYEKKISMEQKNFAVGFRVEHPQSMIDEIQYGRKRDFLPASPYKVTANFPGGRGVYSFCMCPGGYVVNASSEEKRLAVNGMSYSKRQGENANSAIIVSVGERDFGSGDPLAGMCYQKRLEEKAYALGMGKIPQQLFGDYVQNVPSTDYGDFSSHTRGETVFSNLRGLLSPEMEDCFLQGMKCFAHSIPNYDRKDAILSGIESRTSSPIRILRNEAFESNVKGLYPCGEGAGYAGGIMSAAMDGMKVAEAILRVYS